MINPSKETKAEYIGDGLYVDQPYGDMGAIRVTSFNGVTVSDEIFMERPELEALIREAKRRGIIE